MREHQLKEVKDSNGWDYVCTVCGGASDGTFTEECPGEPMSEQDTHDVYHGLIDFFDGAWHAKPKEGWFPRVLPEEDDYNPYRDDSDWS